MSRREKAKLKFPSMPPHLMDQVFDQGPAQGAYGEWMLARIEEGEDASEVVSLVQEFHECKQRLCTADRDLYRHQDLESIRFAMKAAGESKRASRRSNPGYVSVFENPQVSIYRVTSYLGMKSLGRDTRWCTTQKIHYEYYKDRAMFVAVRPSGNTRRAFSKIAIVSSRPITPLDSSVFLKWDDLKFLGKSGSKGFGFEDQWHFYDASDQKTKGSLEEILDILMDIPKGTQELLFKEAGGKPLKTLQKELKALHTATKSEEIVVVARAIAKSGLLNPLSLLGHPKLRKLSACADVWDLATAEQRASLTIENLHLLSYTKAINIPDLFDQYWFHMSRTYASPSFYVSSLLDNTYLTKGTKSRLLEVIRKDLLA